MVKHKRILVTGGAGFIGSHLVEALHAAGHLVVVVDNLSHGDKKRIPVGVKLVAKNIIDTSLLSVFKTFKPDTVYHLAAQVDVARAQADPVYDAKTNILGTLNILECCKKTGVKRIIYADSVAGFGEPRKLPLTADHARAPISFYGISKHTMEHYLQAYSLPFVGLVLANVYGPRQDPLGEGGVVAIFAHRMKKELPVTINGDGEQTRDFIYVVDVVAAFIAAMEWGENQFLMVGTGREITINELFTVMKLMTNYGQKPIYGPPRLEDVQKSVFAIEATKKILSWEPKFNLIQGVQETVA